MGSWRGLFNSNAGIGYDPRRGGVYSTPSSPLHGATRTIRAGAGIIDRIITGGRHIASGEFRPGPDGGHHRHDGAPPGEGATHDRYRRESRQDRQRPPEYDSRLYNSDGSPRADADTTAMRTFYRDGVRIDDPTRAPGQPENLLPENFAANNTNGPVETLTQPTPVEITPLQRPTALDGIITPEIRAQAEIEGRDLDAPAAPAAAAFQMPSSGTQMTTKLANELSAQGIVPLTVGQGAEATTVYMKEGRIVGGYDRTASDRDGGRFIDRDALETKLAGSGKTVAQLETIAGAATQVATQTPAPAAETPGPAAPAVETPRNVFTTPI